MDNACSNLNRKISLDEADQNALTYFLKVITGGKTDERHKLALLVRDWQTSSAYSLLLRPGGYSFSETGDYSLDREKFPSNVVSVLCTLKILVHFFEKSFFTCIQRILTVAPNEKELESLLYGLWLLGYYDIGSWKSGELSYQIIFDRCLSQKYNAFSDFLADKGVPATLAKEQFYSSPLIRFARDLLSDNSFQPFWEKVAPDGIRSVLWKQLDFFKRNGYIFYD